MNRAWAPALQSPENTSGCPASSSQGLRHLCTPGLLQFQAKFTAASTAGVPMAPRVFTTRKEIRRSHTCFPISTSSDCTPSPGADTACHNTAQSPPTFVKEPAAGSRDSHALSGAHAADLRTGAALTLAAVIFSSRSWAFRSEFISSSSSA